MAFKTILVHAEPTAASGARLNVAAALARTFDATVHGVGAAQFAPFVDPMSGFVDPALVQMFEDRLREDLREAEGAFRAVAQESGVNYVWRGFAEYRTPAEVVIDQARCADLAIVTCSEGQDQRGFANPADILMGAGLPVLALPAMATPLQADVVLVAWKNTRESRRAISDALPFLTRAQLVVLAAVVEGDDQAEIAVQLDDVTERLRRHGVSAVTDLSPRLSMPVASQLVGMAEGQGAGLIVAGAYGRTRAREWLFGGVTKDLLRSASTPVLFSR